MTLAGKIDPRKLVFVDEMGTNTSLSPRYAYSPKGRRAYYAQVPRNRGANTTTLLASISLEGMGVRVPGSGRRYDHHGFRGLLPRKSARASSLRRGQQIVVLDNLGAHKSERARKLCSKNEAASYSFCHHTLARL